MTVKQEVEEIKAKRKLKKRNKMLKNMYKIKEIKDSNFSVELETGATYCLGNTVDFPDFKFKNNNPKPKSDEYRYLGLHEPIVKATMVNNRIDVIVACLIPEKYQLKENEFTIWYNFEFGRSGDFKINIFITFNSKEDNLGELVEYKLYPFNININNMALCSRHLKLSSFTGKKGLKSISDVEVFVINGDPKLSRGTVTTVKSPTG